MFSYLINLLKKSLFYPTQAEFLQAIKDIDIETMEDIWVRLTEPMQATYIQELNIKSIYTQERSDIKKDYQKLLNWLWPKLIEQQQRKLFSETVIAGDIKICSDIWERTSEEKRQILISNLLAYKAFPSSRDLEQFEMRKPFSEWLWPKLTTQQQLNVACSRFRHHGEEGNFYACYWYYDKLNVDNRKQALNELGDGFSSVIRYNNIEFIRWYVDEVNKCNLNLQEILTFDQNIFVLSPDCGNLEQIKYLYSLYSEAYRPVLLKRCLANTFDRACLQWGGTYEIAKWLLEITPNQEIKMACLRNYDYRSLKALLKTSERRPLNKPLLKLLWDMAEQSDIPRMTTILQENRLDHLLSELTTNHPKMDPFFLPTNVPFFIPLAANASDSDEALLDGVDQLFANDEEKNNINKLF